MGSFANHSLRVNTLISGQEHRKDHLQHSFESSKVLCPSKSTKGSRDDWEGTGDRAHSQKDPDGVVTEGGLAFPANKTAVVLSTGHLV